MIRLSKKFIRRGITGLALLAPLVYLFGTQLSALAGAHGEEVLATRQVDSFSSSVSLNNNSWISNSSGEDIYLYGYSCSSAVVLPDDSFSVAVSLTGNLDLYTFVRVYFYSDVYLGYSQNDGNPTSISLFSDATSIRFGVAQGSDISLSFTISFYSDSPSYVYSDSLFSSMFGNSNFLTDWGNDAISDNPHGFAPFGNMLQFVDENMLHLSDLQIGLMGYGYFYYCAHVLLFVCFFDLTTFFLSWIMRITHKFGGADYED